MPRASASRRDASVQALLPLGPVVTCILLALADGDRHGLGIAQHVEEFSEGRIVLGPGTLYGAIKRLLNLGLVDDETARPEDEADPRRRYYRLTALGRRALELDTRQLAVVLDVARLKRVIR